MFVCQTRDISREGCFLDTAECVATGTNIQISLLDQHTGNALELPGVVTRTPTPKADGSGRGMGIRFPTPPEGWLALVGRRQTQSSGDSDSQSLMRLRVLVVGDDVRRRGALALYVTSGWDVRFASDLDGLEEALRDFRADAVICEHDLHDPRWRDILGCARRAQPGARRIIRAAAEGAESSPSGDATDLVHRVVDRDAGLDALLDALAADYGSASPAPAKRRT